MKVKARDVACVSVLVVCKRVDSVTIAVIFWRLECSTGKGICIMRSLSNNVSCSGCLDWLITQCE